MERSKIEQNLPEIAISELGEIPRDHEIWEHNDGATHFKVTRHLLQAPGQPEIVSLSVSGQGSERERIIAEFSEVLGEPAARDISLLLGSEVDIVAWLT